MAKSGQQSFFDGFEPTPEQSATSRLNAAAGSVREAALAVNLDAATPASKLSDPPPAEAKSSGVPATVEVTYSLEYPEMPEDLNGQTVVLIDSHSLIYQIFHALAPMSSPAGVPVAAVYGFLRDVADLRDRWQSAFLWCTFDLSEVTFRNALYPEYKAHRDPMPDELRSQIPLIRETLQLLGAGVVDAPGFEADDIIATMAAQVAQAGGRCIVVTSDKDCRQLLNDHV